MPAALAASVFSVSWWQIFAFASLHEVRHFSFCLNPHSYMAEHGARRESLAVVNGLVIVHKRPVHHPEKGNCNQNADEHHQSGQRPHSLLMRGQVSFSTPNGLLWHILDLYARRRRPRHQVFTPYGLSRISPVSRLKSVFHPPCQRPSRQVCGRKASDRIYRIFRIEFILPILFLLSKIRRLFISFPISSIEPPAF